MVHLADRVRLVCDYNYKTPAGPVQIIKSGQAGLVVSSRGIGNKLLTVILDSGQEIKIKEDMVVVEKH